eukprot:CAMPEP_0197904474 /NCGR_PEP_ID=MMETSP1439-20131203/58160_1 /TAXON_ID=66791 /ORGANISM="Gonyaulax spinifera, Strain CCMP409" /LENGTH=155 /DNA_ID=CAMNT_0043525671 /DNA_START=108 /DNA_END=575 /DNA_ORIENTATION=-
MSAACAEVQQAERYRRRPFCGLPQVTDNAGLGGEDRVVLHHYCPLVPAATHLPVHPEVLQCKRDRPVGQGADSIPLLLGNEAAAHLFAQPVDEVLVEPCHPRHRVVQPDPHKLLLQGLPAHGEPGGVHDEHRIDAGDRIAERSRRFWVILLHDWW